MIPMIWRNSKNYAILYIPKIRLAKQAYIIKTGRPDRLSMTLLHLNLGKQR